MALYQASDFTGFSDSYAVPAGSSDVICTGSVDLILSTGITQQDYYFVVFVVFVVLCVFVVFDVFVVFVDS